MIIDLPTPYQTYFYSYKWSRELSEFYRILEFFAIDTIYIYIYISLDALVHHLKIQGFEKDGNSDRIFEKFRKTNKLKTIF